MCRRPLSQHYALTHIALMLFSQDYALTHIALMLLSQHYALTHIALMLLSVSLQATCPILILIITILILIRSQSLFKRLVLSKKTQMRRMSFQVIVGITSMLV